MKKKRTGNKKLPSGQRNQEGQSGAARQPLGAEGYGLDEGQQKIASDLWAWQRESLRSAIVLGGPING